MPWVGVLTQKHGDRYRSLSYSGQQLDPVAQDTPLALELLLLLLSWLRLQREQYIK